MNNAGFELGTIFGKREVMPLSHCPREANELTNKLGTAEKNLETRKSVKGFSKRQAAKNERNMTVPFLIKCQGLFLVT